MQRGRSLRVALCCIRPLSQYGGPWLPRFERLHFAQSTQSFGLIAVRREIDAS